MKKDNKIILVGGGGHCKSCIDIIEAENKYTIAGILDIKENRGIKVLGYPIIGSEEDEDIFVQFDNFLITVGHIKNPIPRIRLYEMLKLKKVNFPVIFSPYSYVSKSAQIGQGTIVCHASVINSEVIVGENCIINTNSLIEHEVIVGNHTQISTSAVVNGQVKIGSKCFIGSSAVINNNISICDDVVIGSGSVVNRNIQLPGIYAGVPFKKIK